MKSIRMIEELCQAHSPSGFESPVKELIKEYLKDHVHFCQDNMGSLICEKTGSGDLPKIMIPGHIDEIGFMVNSITKNGFLKFVPLGGWWDQVLLAQKVIVKTCRGDLMGVIGSVPPHLLSPKDKEKIFEKKDMFIDIGAGSKEEAEQMGVQPGDPVVPSASFHLLGDTGMFMGKALDNRLGCAAFIDVLKALQDIDHPNTVYGVGTVQEEVGLRGATTAVNMVEPDLCFVVDVTVATDTPGLEKEASEVKLGQGPVLTLADASMIANRSLRNLVIATAKENNIPLQFNTMMGGGTDGGSVHKYGPGVPSVVLSFPTRYIHSHYGISNYRDYENTVSLLLALIKKIDCKIVSDIKNGA